MSRIYRAQKMPNAKHYHKGRLKFDYLTKSQLQALQTVSVLGRVNLKKSRYKSDDSTFTLKIPYEKSETVAFWYDEIPKNKKTKGSVLGYVKVGVGQYVEVIATKSFLPLFLLLFLCLLGAGAFWFYYRPSGDDGPGIADATDWDGNLPSNGDDTAMIEESITIPGYADLHISHDSPTVQLINPDGNTVNMVYTISYKDNVIYETDGAIPAGKAVEADFYQLFDGKAGSYDLTFLISTYDVTTDQPCNGATQAVTLTIQ